MQERDSAHFQPRPLPVAPAAVPGGGRAPWHADPQVRALGGRVGETGEGGERQLLRPRPARTVQHQRLSVRVSTHAVLAALLPGSK